MTYMGLKDIAGAISDEIGGGNGIQPMIVAGEMNKVVLDADLMGRAYPNVGIHFGQVRIRTLEIMYFLPDVPIVSTPGPLKADLSDTYPLDSLPGAFNIPGGMLPCAISDGVGNTVVNR